jgi:hypothetical protein
MVGTITQKTKGKAIERPTKVQPTGTKEGRKLIPLMVRSYLIHSPSNVTYMQIVRSKNNNRFKTNISHQSNLPFYNKS